MPMATDPAAYDQGAENIHQDGDPEPQRGRGSTRSTKQLAAPLRIPKNRSTGNLAVVAEAPERARLRFSFDVGSGVAESDQIIRSPIITEHDHGLGISGLRRIRQHPTPRTPTMPSTAFSSRSPSTGLPRSTSMSMLLPSGHHTPLTPGPASPSFAEDLSRFPSESLHSFSFAHQSEEFIHNRQNVLKRSIEFMKDRMGWATSSNAGLVSAQARVAGDVETQNMLDLLARARLVGAGNLPNVDPAVAPGPLSGPAGVSHENVFEKDFIPRTSSPESFATPLVSPTTARGPSLDQPYADSTQLTRDDGDEPTSKKLDVLQDHTESENSSRTPTNESGTTAQTSPPISRRPSLRRTFTDVVSAEMQQKIVDTMAQPFQAGSSEGFPEALLSPAFAPLAAGSSIHTPGALGPTVHGHATRWVPAAQAIFTTESKPPWTILAANDLACLVFGMTKAEVRKMGILEVVQEERRAWLENKLLRGDSNDISNASAEMAPPPIPSSGSSLLGGRGGITAHLLSKPNSRAQRSKAPARAQTVHSGDATPSRSRGSSHRSSKSRGVLLCGDVVPIQKRNGATGSASLWVKEKRVGLIWVLEEIHEDVALVSLDEDGIVTKVSGNTGPIWGEENLQPGMDVGKLIPRIPRQGIDPRYGAIDYAQIAKRRYFTCQNSEKVNIPAIISQTRGQTELRVSSFPHIAGIIVVSPDTLKIKSSNSAFCGALFGHEKPEGQLITNLIPDFDDLLELLVDHDGIQLQDGLVVPEHSFRKAAALLALHDNRPDVAATFLSPDGLPAKHRDGSELKIDVQMRVVKSEKQSGHDSSSSDDEAQISEAVVESEVVYALWITYSRHLHSSNIKRTLPENPKSPSLSGVVSPLHQPSPGQTPAHTPQDIGSDTEEPKNKPTSTASALSQQLKVVAMNAAAKLTGASRTPDKPASETITQADPPARKKTIDDFVILEDMGQGAYGQVKLARYKYNGGKKVVLKDRRLGTVPLEIHVLDYLRRDGFKHPNIVEMEDFFEDDVNYYIEMAPHGYPGMDLFDYIELRANMEEDECRSIFIQVARAIHHLHTKAKVVHRDIKDENIILDGEGNIKLIDFGSAAYIKSGPFDVFVGTIDYAAPEVLAGKPYGGKEQDVWALGILLYTIIYKENPFYSIDEIMDRDLRVPYVISEESIDLIRCMLDRDVEQRYDIEQVLQHPWCQEE
ncbi:hypothetical protein M426DRAFT_18720 [Hypoxylon sp. CI-4A]|nr:hypothetical protein M426DRAFT_18720 [Hypoxylon sp. CI-4A]